MKQINFVNSEGKFVAKISWNENKFVIKSAIPVVIKPKEKTIYQNDEFFFNFASLLNNFMEETKQDELFESLEKSYKEILEFEKSLNRTYEYEDNLNTQFINFENTGEELAEPFEEEPIEEPVD
jgi:hypothetical protein